VKLKTIKKEIVNHFDKFCESITDKKVQAMVQRNTILAGGSIASMFQQESVRDFDFYFRNKETVLAVLEYYLYKAGINNNIIIKKTDDRIKLHISSAGLIKLKPRKDAKFAPIVFSDNAITLTDKTQLILRFFGEPEQILENYDFAHVTNYWTSWDQQIVTNELALTCLLTKELVYQGSLYPLASLFRIRKFINRGWSITAGHVLKIALQISKLDLTDFEVFQDQLIGVDVSYFASMVEILKQKYDKDGCMDLEYIIELVDKFLHED